MFNEISNIIAESVFDHINSLTIEELNAMKEQLCREMVRMTQSDSTDVNTFMLKYKVELAYIEYRISSLMERD